MLGVDLDDEKVRARSWRWFRVRLIGLASDPGTHLNAFLFPRDAAPDPDAKEWPT